MPATDKRAPRRIVIAISGASGAVYGLRLLQALQGMASIESHLVVSDAGWRNLLDVSHDLAARWQGHARPGTGV